MESTKYLIIGGGIAGTTAAFTIRQRDPEGRIIIVQAEPHALYSRVALPGFSRGQTSRERVFLKTDSDYADHSIELWTETSVAALDSSEKIVTLTDGRRMSYEALLIATGGHVRQWLTPGSALPEVLSMRTIDDAETIVSRLPRTKHAVIVGGGFITLEHIQTLTKAGIATTVVIRDPYYWANILDEESGKLLQQLLAQATSTHFLYNTSVEEVMGSQKVEAVLLSNGQKLVADLILTNIGIRPNTDWLDQSGLAISGGIETDVYLRTSADEVWAAGDVALFEDELLGGKHRLGNWTNATAQGEAAGKNMTGANQPFEAISTYSISLFGTNISFIGQTSAHPSIIVIPRGSARSGAYGRMLVRNDRLIGATLINRFPERQPLEQLIKHQIPLTGRDISDLTDETQPIRETVSHLLTKYKIT